MDEILASIRRIIQDEDVRKSGVRSRADLYDLVSAPRGWHPRRGGPGGSSPARG
ncbi:MAG: hypothetical protein J0I18_01300 [Actinobacteria bacterium]|nr:hypothetical protein [Actinomycetota bacterium]